MLADSAVYYLALDPAEQHAALLDSYASTGGQYWTNQPENDTEYILFSEVVGGVVEAGNDLASGSTDVSTLPDLVSDAASLALLSTDCALQQYLSLGQLWLSHPWDSNVSYCLWSGITCCETVHTS